MTQLTLQFEGYADEVRQPETQETAKQSAEATTAWLGEQNRLFTELAGTPVSNLLVVRATAATVFTFALMYLSALIGG